MNRAILLGRLGKDPDVKIFDDGGKVANFSLATSEKWKSKDGEPMSSTEWHNITVRGKSADVAEKYLTKGSQVLIEGKIKTRSWETRDGDKKYITEIICDRFEFVGSKGDNAGQGAPAAESKPASKPEPKTNDWDGDDDLPF